jgi:ketosteroid isomerase-like protein
MEAKRAMEERNVGWVEAYKRGDAAGVASFYAEDAILMPPNQPMVRGKKALQEFFQGMIDQVGGTHTTPQMVEFGVEGDLAYQVATFTITDTKTPFQGRFVEIFCPLQDGSWKIHLCIWNNAGRG